MLGYLPIEGRRGCGAATRSTCTSTRTRSCTRCRSDIPAEIATLFNPLGAGIPLGGRDAAAGDRRDDRRAGAGAARAGVASSPRARRARACIIVTGLSRDERKLALAREFGAHHTIDVEREDPIARVREITDGRMADVVIDVTAYAVEAVTQAIDLARARRARRAGRHEGAEAGRRTSSATRSSARS